jgi:hypothetical protein
MHTARQVAVVRVARPTRHGEGEAREARLRSDKAERASK